MSKNYNNPSSCTTIQAKDDQHEIGISPTQHFSKWFFKAFGNSKRTFRKVTELYFQSSAAVQFDFFDIADIDYFILRNRAKVLNLLLR